MRIVSSDHRIETGSDWVHFHGSLDHTILEYDQGSRFHFEGHGETSGLAPSRSPSCCLHRATAPTVRVRLMCVQCACACMRGCVCVCVCSSDNTAAKESSARWLIPQSKANIFKKEKKTSVNQTLMHIIGIYIKTKRMERGRKSNKTHLFLKPVFKKGKPQ